jgi:hypothetical protein
MKKKKQKLSRTGAIIVACIILSGVGAYIYFDKEMLADLKLAIDTVGILPFIITILSFAIIASLCVYVITHKPKIWNKVIKTLAVIWREIWVPFTILIIMFLGYLHDKYPYESHFQENVTATFIILANSTTSIYNVGTKIPGIGWAAIWIGLFYFGIQSAIQVWKKKEPKGLNTNKDIKQ